MIFVSLAFCIVAEGSADTSDLLGDLCVPQRYPNWLFHVSDSSMEGIAQLTRKRIHRLRHSLHPRYRHRRNLSVYANLYPHWR
jgi:hypothetical protein